MKALIVDDNNIARTTLAHLAKQIPNLDIVHEYDNAIAAYNHLQSDRIDLLFLDIEMPEMTGIDLTRILVVRRLSSFLNFLKKSMPQRLSN